MRWLTAVLSIPLIAFGTTGETDRVELGGRFVPTAGTSLRWTLRTEMKDGTYAGVRGIAPMEGKVDKVDDREILTTYLSADKREVLVARGQTQQVETFGGQTETNERKMALQGVPLIGRLIDGKWGFVVAVGEATDEQKPELERLARRANEEVDLFEGVAPRVGDSWEIDGAKFLKAAGFDGVTNVLGTARGTLKEVKASSDDPEAVIGLEIDLRAVQPLAGGGQQRMRVKYTGQITRRLASKLDRLVELDGSMVVFGEVITQDNQRSPFSLNTPIKFRGVREVVKK